MRCTCHCNDTSTCDYLKSVTGFQYFGVNEHKQVVFRCHGFVRRRATNQNWAAKLAVRMPVMMGIDYISYFRSTGLQLRYFFFLGPFPADSAQPS